MAFSWNGRFILRRIEESDPGSHRIYKHAASGELITDADNFFATAPSRASKQKWKAVRVAPPREWQVTLDGLPPTTTPMGVFQLKSIP